jgi:hypothetical protein
MTPTPARKCTVQPSDSCEEVAERADADCSERPVPTTFWVRQDRQATEEAGIVQIAREEVLRVLRRAGMTESAEALVPVLPEVVDLDRDAELLARYGVTHDRLISRLGGSS